MMYSQVVTATVAANAVDVQTPPCSGILMGVQFFGNIGLGTINIQVLDETDDSKSYTMVTDSGTNHVTAMGTGYYKPTSQSMSSADASVINPRQEFALFKNRIRIVGSGMTNGQTGEWRFLFKDA